MKINILTIFPDFFDSFKSHSIEKRAIDGGFVSIDTYNIRDYSKDKHKKVDDYPFGGGAGMVMAPQPIFDCFDDVISKSNSNNRINVYMSAKGERVSEKVVKGFLGYDEINILCGHYEGVDQRVIDEYIDKEISIGDYILTGGEIPAMVFIDATIRFVPGVLGNESSVYEESFSNGLLECAHYTRPNEFRGRKVPDVLLSGNHKKIEEFRTQSAAYLTSKMRPDLINDLDEE